MVRVIGGEARGRRLALPGKCEVRPTADFVREALFNILGPQDGKIWADLYAGTGAVGIEALSRGAAKSVFVESNRSCCEAIRANLAKCGFVQRAEIIEKPAGLAIKVLGNRGEVFDVIFADPPYNKGLVASTLDGIVESGMGSEGSEIIIQHSVKEPVRLESSLWIVSDQRIYGDTEITIITSARV